jgi:hypothetical protein
MLEIIQKFKARRKPLLCTPQRTQLEQWLLESPPHRRIKFQSIPRYIPEFEGVGEKSIKAAFDLLGYCRRTSKRKGFSEEPDVLEERVAFAHEGITWKSWESEFFQTRFGQWEGHLQHHMLLSKRMVQTGIILRIFNTNTQKHLLRCFMDLLLKGKRDLLGKRMGQHELGKLWYTHPFRSSSLHRGKPRTYFYAG